MPKFYVRLVGDDGVEDSADALEYSDLESLLADTVKSARLLLAEKLVDGKLLHLERRYEIYGEDGELLHTVLFHSLLLSGD
jgi:hypothetical protein